MMQGIVMSAGVEGSKGNLFFIRSRIFDYNSYKNQNIIASKKREDYHCMSVQKHLSRRRTLTVNCVQSQKI